MSVRQASRAVHSLAGRELLTVVKVGVPGKPSLYSVLPSSVLRKLNPTAAQWVEDNRPTLDADVETYRHPCLPS
jgi:hypothetical protein